MWVKLLYTFDVVDEEGDEGVCIGVWNWIIMMDRILSEECLKREIIEVIVYFWYIWRDENEICLDSYIMGEERTKECLSMGYRGWWIFNQRYERELLFRSSIWSGVKERCGKVLVVSSFIESSLLVILTLCTMTHPDGVTYSQSYFSSYIGCLDKSKKKM